ncbi:MAG: hypothetical protein ABIJ26_03765, partial [Candidatus Margulisiibacteriota bacterium]
VKEAWVPTNQNEKDRIESSIFRRGPDLFKQTNEKDYPSREERKALKEGGYKYTYYSINRPLSYLLTRQTMPDAKISESGKYVFTKTPLDLENVYRWELIADGQDTKGALAVDYYRKVHGDKPIELFNDSKGIGRWQGAVIHKTAQGEEGYRVSNFDEDGFSGHEEFATEQEAVGQAISDGYRKFQPGLLDDAQKDPKFFESMAKVEKAQKEFSDRSKAKREEPSPVKELTAAQETALKQITHPVIEEVTNKGKVVRIDGEVQTAPVDRDGLYAINELDKKRTRLKDLVDCLRGSNG